MEAVQEPLEVDPAGAVKTASVRTTGRGLQIESLAPGDRLIIRTASATYDVTVISPRTRQVLISGGAMFPAPINARLDGCSSGGAFLRLGGIEVGCTLEFRTPKDVVVTATVRSIAFVEQG